jgi:hypothetical protein
MSSDDYVLNITVKSAMSRYPEAATLAMTAEIRQFVVKKVGIPSTYAVVNSSSNAQIIPVHLFLTEKFHPDGRFNKIKARCVINGARQDRDLYPDVSSPTVCLPSLLMVLSIAAFHDMDITTTDVVGAFLGAPLHSPHSIFAKFPPNLAAIYVQQHHSVYGNSIESFLLSDGSLLLELKMAMYGLIEAAKMFYLSLISTLTAVGYVVSAHDRCVLYKHDSSSISILCIHVDDILQVTSSPALKEELQVCLRRQYSDTSTESGDLQFYLGMQITRDRVSRSITLTNPKFVTDILAAHPPPRIFHTPASHDILSPSPSSPPADKSSFASQLMKLMYLATRSRPDLLLACSLLATKLQSPSTNDFTLLARVYGYVKHTQLLGLRLQPTSLHLHLWADASYGTHIDLKSHGGHCLGFPGAMFLFKSGKQRITVDNTCYAELVQANEAIKDATPCLGLLLQLFPTSCKFITLYQDNQSSIILATRGSGFSGRSRHVNIRYFMITEAISDGRIKVSYLPTDQMIADIFTKPLTGTSFFHLRALLLNSSS